MATIKQKTVDGTTVRVRRLRTDEPGKQFEYHISRPGNPNIVDPVFTRREAMREFRAIIDRYEREGVPKGRSETSSGGVRFNVAGGSSDDDDDGGSGLSFGI